MTCTETTCVRCFAKDSVSAPITWCSADSLSPGEQARGVTRAPLGAGVNALYLVLDEPTNHLDLPAIEQLERALGAFAGTHTLVTHDRQLLDAVTLARRIGNSPTDFVTGRSSAWRRSTIAAAVATFNESTDARIGMRTCMSAASSHAG